MTYRFVVGLLSLLGVAVQAGCGHGCDEIGCQPGVEVDLGRVFDEPGSYRVTVAVDGETTVCMVTLPRMAAESCDGEDVWTQGRGEVTSSGNAESQGPARNLTGVSVLGEPEQIEVAIELDGQQLLRDTVTPVYRDEEINGEGCGTCRQGAALVEVD